MFDHRFFQRGNVDEGPCQKLVIGPEPLPHLPRLGSIGIVDQMGGTVFVVVALEDDALLFEVVLDIGFPELRPGEQLLQRLRGPYPGYPVPGSVRAGVAALGQID